VTDRETVRVRHLLDMPEIRLRHLLDVSEKQREETMDGLREVAKQRDELEAENTRLREDLAAAKGREAQVVEALEKIQDYALEYQDLNTDMKEISAMAKQALSADGRAYAERVKRLEEALEDCLKWFNSNEVQICFSMCAMRDITQVSKEFSDWAGKVWDNARAAMEVSANGS